MHSFKDLAALFQEYFSVRHFPEHTTTLYEPAQYILQLGGKRIRPVCVLMGNELFGEIVPDAYHAAAGIELFHNFSLIHDDIMDKAPVRRGLPTVHAKYGENTALLAGDVMFVKAYEYLNKMKEGNLKRVLHLFNSTAAQVCEGQQLDMDFELRDTVSLEEYVNMITLKTSVLVAASLQLGAILGGTGERNQHHIYEFGKNLGIAFQVQDDYLDAFGDPEKFGKQVGGDILANKKTFLLIHTLEVASAQDKATLQQLLHQNPPDKVKQVLQLFKKCAVDDWANALKEKYLSTALQHLEEIAVVSKRKEPLKELAAFLIQRSY
ncbi:MAG TPA: polyprenyl synthetase family protein [Ferruginibacter sp.]|nr:polyprenyl synthetase family protein [Ferruginibacter sp.]HMP21284.1 polyprenyl synthetase family protein [Ferruginibacter sp.]